MKGEHVLRQGHGRMGRTRAMLEKAVGEGMSPSESIMLKGDLACLAARIAKVNARVGREVVSLSPYARLAKDPAAAIAV